MLHHQHLKKRKVCAWILPSQSPICSTNKPMPRQSHEEACPEKHGFCRREMQRLVEYVKVLCGCIPVQYHRYHLHGHHHLHHHYHHHHHQHHHRHHHHHHHHHHHVADVCKGHSLCTGNSLSHSKSQNIFQQIVRCWSTDQDLLRKPDALRKKCFKMSSWSSCWRCNWLDLSQMGFQKWNIF